MGKVQFIWFNVAFVIKLGESHVCECVNNTVGNWAKNTTSLKYSQTGSSSDIPHWLCCSCFALCFKIEIDDVGRFDFYTNKCVFSHVKLFRLARQKMRKLFFLHENFEYSKRNETKSFAANYSND